jgi:hypothetical protein
MLSVDQAFYDKPGWDGRVTFLAAPDPEAPKRCGLMNEKTDMLISWRQINGQGAQFPRLPNPPYNSILVYRYVS